MSKLLKLKQWVTIADAARYLSQSLSEPVTEADVLKLGIDGQLVLSVYLPNGLGVQRFEEVDPANVKSRGGRMPDEWNDGEDTEGRHVIFFRSRFLRLRNPDGLGSTFYDDGWTLDLAMIGSEKAEIEEEFQRHFGGPDLVNRGAGYALLLDATGELLLARQQLVRRFNETLTIRSSGSRSSSTGT